MNNPIVVVVLMVLLLMAIVSPFSALAMLMLFAVGSVLLWGVATILQTLLSGRHS